MTAFISTQSVECFAEWSLLPSNLAFKNVMEEGIYDPIQVGDKAKWFAHHLLVKEHKLWDDDSNGDLKELLLKIENKSKDDLGGNTDESLSSDEDSEEHLSSESLSSEADFAKNDGFASEEEMRPVSEELTSFPSDVSIGQVGH